jgi:hypothetical protein
VKITNILRYEDDNKKKFNSNILVKNPINGGIPDNESRVSAAINLKKVLEPNEANLKLYEISPLKI